VTATGDVVAGKRRILKFREEHPDAKVTVRELHHYASPRFLERVRAARASLCAGRGTRLEDV